MINYKDYEKKVYEWLSDKNVKDPNFTFSLRMKGSKGAELDFFIGTKKSNYFGTTFWTIPVGFPGSSGDCIDLFFMHSDSDFSYYVEFNQTNSPHDEQNKSALNLIRSVENELNKSIGLLKKSKTGNKMFTVKSKPKKKSYTNLDDMLKDIDQDLTKIIPLVNKYIEKEKKINPEFEAHRISKEEFANMKSKLQTRFEKYSDLNDQIKDVMNLKDEFIVWLLNKPKSNYFNNDREKLNRYLDTYNTYFDLDIFEVSKLNFKVIIDEIDKVAYQDENSEFFKFSDGESNHRPRAILGKTNYYKFLEEKFNKQKGTSSNKPHQKAPLNQILYGPPGTGKTYYLKDQLFDKYTSKQTSISKDQYFETVVSNCTWWQVIAIALLELGNSKVSDIHENDWVKKKASLSNSNSVRPTLWGQLQSHTIDDCKYVKFTNRMTPQIFTKTEDSFWEVLKEQVEELAPELYKLKDSVDNYNPDPDKVVKHYDFVTFHQSFSYEDFIEGIKPIFLEEGQEAKDLGYKVENGVFKNMCIKAQNDPNNQYAIFIDEINRGNVSAIFGELITLIETDKRKGAENEMNIKLPYSKKEFSVPFNLDIYGTMNTADRSVEALDTALRRRFKFKEMMPNYEVIKNKELGGVQLSEVLKTINERIELLVDRDHTIGHSYFININSTEELASAFNDRVVPLLQEYFYGDYGKIGLVLGKGFVKTNKNSNIKFAQFNYDNSSDFITESQTLLKQNENTIINSIKLLLNKSEE